jgi:CheY-like chemotaxis protein
MSDESPLMVLLIEDNPLDVEIAREVLGAPGSDGPVIEVAEDGPTGLAKARGRTDSGRRPDLVLLDINLPGMNGFEVLEALRDDPDPAVRRTPVVIFSTSAAPVDIARAHDLHASCFVSKPLGFDECERVLLTLQDFWLRSAQLPSRHAA